MSVKPYDNPSSKKEQVRTMFDRIAGRYDLLNHVLSMSIDRLWRRRTVRLVAARAPRRVLDVATGTGDLAIKLARELDPIAVTGVDLSEGMIEIGRAKVAKEGLQEVVTLGIGDCLLLPFTDASFDAVTCAYGVRNFADLLAGYREMHRVLRPGGRAVILELSTPTSPMVRPLYNFYTRHVIPTVGRLVSKDVRAYSYLPESIAAVPQGDAMTAIMLEAGFSQARAIPLTMGVCTIYEAVS